MPGCTAVLLCTFREAESGLGVYLSVLPPCMLCVWCGAGARRILCADDGEEGTEINHPARWLCGVRRKKVTNAVNGICIYFHSIDSSCAAIHACESHSSLLYPPWFHGILSLPGW